MAFVWGSDSQSVSFGVVISDAWGSSGTCRTGKGELAIGSGVSAATSPAELFCWVLWNVRYGTLAYVQPMPVCFDTWAHHQSASIHAT